MNEHQLGIRKFKEYDEYRSFAVQVNKHPPTHHLWNMFIVGRGKAVPRPLASGLAGSLFSYPIP